ncbi:DUF952 domain-containing protein [Thioclava sp. GXIMD2076]|uniref:DUF952 domain-containing protein n=1 Tax=Thioclava sp. GXIMD2076 TaxID=3131931 RepID=UPI0030CE8621
MLIYKIFRPAEWQALQSQGSTSGAPIDLADGYIHISTAEQVRETAAKHFAQAGDLVLVSLEADTLGHALRWEVSRGGALFPHLYRDMTMADVIAHMPLPQGPEGHIFPETL